MKPMKQNEHALSGYCTAAAGEKGSVRWSSAHNAIATRRNWKATSAVCIAWLVSISVSKTSSSTSSSDDENIFMYYWYERMRKKKNEDWMPKPNKVQWKRISQRSESLWNLPNCIGSLNGKHIRIEKLPNTGSSDFNYKAYRSIVLLACSDTLMVFLQR